MIQVITKEWQITKAYIEDIALQAGLRNLEWDDFKAFAESEFEKYRVIQDKNYQSDFDRLMAETDETKHPN